MKRTTTELCELFQLAVTPPYLAALLDTPNEVWVRYQVGYRYVLAVWRDGRVVNKVAHEAVPSSPVCARHIWWSIGAKLVIERVVHDDAVVVYRAHLNGPLHTSVEPPGNDLEPPSGFREISPWEIPPFGRVHRQFVRYGDGEPVLGERPIAAVWVVSVAGTEVRTSGGEGVPWHANQKVEACATRGDVIARHEQLVEEHMRAGYEMRMIEFLEATGHHPAPPLVRTEDPYAAVDAAMTRIQMLRATYPVGHFVVEELDPVRDADVLRRHGHDKFFTDMHAETFGRWTSIRDAPRAGSSFDYFLARYRSVTWIVASEMSQGLPMFYCGNVSGGGWCCLEVGDLGVDLEEFDKAHPGLGYATARVFHGGWGCTGFVFDQRVASPTGEHPSYPFSLDGPTDDLMPAQPVDSIEIEAFGHWLEREVHKIGSEIVHRLPFYQT